MPHILTEHPLNLDDTTVLQLPAGARIVNIGLRGEAGGHRPILVVRSDQADRQHTVERTFLLVRPGRDVPPSAKYLGLLSVPWLHRHVLEVTA